MSTGKLNTERAQALAQLRGIALFAVGDKVTTNHGNEATISEIIAYGDNAGLYWNMCAYHVSGEAFGPGGMLVDFIDAHYTLGGTLRKA